MNGLERYKADRAGHRPARVQPVTDGRYDGVMDFVDAATKELRYASNSSIVVDLLEQSRGRWYGAGCDTGRDVVKKLTDGWPEGQKKLETLTAKLIDVDVTAKDRRRRRVKADFGDSVDIHAIYAGRFETAWDIPKRRDAHGPQRVDILANMICAGNENSDVLFWRGAAAIVLADKLERAGYMVRLVVGFGGRNGCYEKTSCRVTVKDHDKPLDVTTTASVLLPGFFRAIGHAWLAAHASGRVYSCGISVENSKQDDGELVLSHDVRDEHSAREWLTRTVTDFNDNAYVI